MRIRLLVLMLLLEMTKAERRMQKESAQSRRRQIMANPQVQTLPEALSILRLAISLELDAWDLVLSEPDSGQSAAFAETTRLPMRPWPAAVSCNRNGSMPRVRCRFRADNRDANA